MDERMKKKNEGKLLLSKYGRKREKKANVSIYKREVNGRIRKNEEWIEWEIITRRK